MRLYSNPAGLSVCPHVVSGRFSDLSRNNQHILFFIYTDVKNAIRVCVRITCDGRRNEEAKKNNFY